MSKKTQRTAPVAAVEAAAPAAPSKPITIKVTEKVAKLAGTRLTWYTAIKAYDGKPLEDFLNSKLPALPPKGTVKGRLQFLARSGLVKFSA
jgi:hypothetical protein